MNPLWGLLIILCAAAIYALGYSDGKSNERELNDWKRLEDLVDKIKSRVRQEGTER